MKNFAKFLIFVVLLSAAVSLLYDRRLKQGGTSVVSRRTPEKYTLASTSGVDPKDVASLEALSRERRALINKVVPSVVAVKTSKKISVRREGALDPFEFYFRNRRQPFRNPRDEALVQNSLGSGVIVTNEGHIITNNHVVDQVDEIEVQLSDGRTKKARVVGADAQVDLAVLKIDDPDVKPLKLADSDAVQAGDFVLAIGNPFGFDETVTDGIISSKGRPNRTDVFGDLLQTNAAINPGNSGGPLINLRGEVVGINTAIISRSGGSQGIGFAIPSNTVRTALESLLKQGRIIRGYLGIQTRPSQPGQPNADADGVVIDDVVPGSPAAAANLRKGDVIRKFNGHDVKTFPELRSLVSQVELNKNVEVEVIRERQADKGHGGDQGTTGRLSDDARRSAARRAATAAFDPGRARRRAVMARLKFHSCRRTNATLARQLDLPNGVRGVVVTDVDPDSGAADLQKGDVIEEVKSAAGRFGGRLQQDCWLARSEPDPGVVGLPASRPFVCGFAATLDRF